MQETVSASPERPPDRKGAGRRAEGGTLFEEPGPDSARWTTTSCCPHLAPGRRPDRDRQSDAAATSIAFSVSRRSGSDRSLMVRL